MAALAGPRVVMGDFNEWHPGPVSRRLKREFSSPMRRMRRTHPAVFPLFPLDRLYWDVELEGREFHVHGSRLARVASIADHVEAAIPFCRQAHFKRDLRSQHPRDIAERGRHPLSFQVRRRGTRVTERSPEAVIRREAPGLRIVSEKLWREVLAVNQSAAESSWRSPDGRLKSRPTGHHFLPQFLACGMCGGSLHVRFSKKRKEYLFCTNRHLLGKERCPNARRLPVEFAEKFITQTFEEGLAGAIVMEKLEEVLEWQRAAQADPEPLKAEAKSLRASVLTRVSCPCT